MKVKIRSWKKIKSITRKDSDGNRCYKDSSIFFNSSMKEFCGTEIHIEQKSLATVYKATESGWIIEPWMCKGGKF